MDIGCGCGSIPYSQIGCDKQLFSSGQFLKRTENLKCEEDRRFIIIRTLLYGFGNSVILGKTIFVSAYSVYIPCSQLGTNQNRFEVLFQKDPFVYMSLCDLRSF